MASIKISTLNNAGLDLFTDAESYMLGLSNEEMNHIQGGGTPIAASWYIGGAVLGALGVIGAAIAADKKQCK
jgi:uncharacterized protein GlcG (DUF336 family)